MLDVPSALRAVSVRTFSNRTFRGIWHVQYLMHARQVPPVLPVDSWQQDLAELLDPLRELMDVQAKPAVNKKHDLTSDNVGLPHAVEAIESMA